MLSASVHLRTNAISLKQPTASSVIGELSTSPLVSSGFQGSSPGLQMIMSEEKGAYSSDREEVLSDHGIDTDELPPPLSAKRPAESQFPSDVASAEKRKPTPSLVEDQLCSRYQALVEEVGGKDELIAALREELTVAREQLRATDTAHSRTVKAMSEEIASLKYDVAAHKALNHELSESHDEQMAKTSSTSRIQRLEMDISGLRQDIAQRDVENQRLKAQLDKVNDDYVRLSEDQILDPADAFSRIEYRDVECTFRPITPPANDQECINPGYSENCHIANTSILTTANAFASRHSAAPQPLTPLEKRITGIADNEKQITEAGTPSTSWWSKARAPRKIGKWTELPSLPGPISDQCAAVEHLNRLYVAATVQGGPGRSHTPTPSPTVVLYVFHEKERKFCDVNIPSPPDATHPTGLFSHNSRLYLVTAQDGGDSIWSLDMQLKQWTFISANVNGETACACCLVDDHIIMAGGAKKDGHGTSCAVVQSFSISDMSWNHGWPALVSPRLSARLVRAGAFLYVLGGGVGSTQKGFKTMEEVERLDLTDIRKGWKEVGALRQSAPAAVATASCVIAAGGLVRRPEMKQVRVADLLEVDGGGLKLSHLPNLTVQRSTACLVTFNQRLLCIGGCTQQGSFCGVVDELVYQ